MSASASSHSCEYIVLRFLFVCAIRFVCCFMPGMYLVFANYFFSLRIHLTPGSAYFSSVLCFIFVIPFSFLGWYIFLGFGFVSFFFPFSFYGFHYMFFFCVSLFFVVRFSVFRKISGLLACVYLACWRAYVVVPVVSSKMTWDFVVHSTSALECKYLCVVVCYHRAWIPLLVAWKISTDTGCAGDVDGQRYLVCVLPTRQHAILFSYFMPSLSSFFIYYVDFLSFDVTHICVDWVYRLSLWYPVCVLHIKPLFPRVYPGIWYCTYWGISPDTFVNSVHQYRYRTLR